jgi:hypothetical protein
MVTRLAVALAPAALALAFPGLLAKGALVCLVTCRATNPLVELR